MSNGKPGEEIDPIDPGEPVAELAGFEHDVSARFMSRIRHAIQRRTTAVQLTTFAFDLPLVVLKELWLMMVGQFDSMKVEKDTRK
jgi:hypothetical protein